MEAKLPERLSCKYCGKYSQSELSHKRHQRYCKTKAGASKSRRRSCYACIKAKARCDTNGPVCVRCDSKGILCQFEPKPQHLTTSPDLDINDFTSDTTYLDQVPFQYMVDDLPSSVQQGQVALPLSGKPYDSTPQNLVPSSDTDLENLDFETSFSQFDDIWKSSFAFEGQSPKLPSIETSLHKPKLFEPKPMKQLGAISSSNMITRILRSYPDMMRRRTTFPPFIHPRCYGSEEDNWKLPTSLANAMSIAQMFYHRTVENKPFIWQSIRMEIQRMFNEYTQLGERELLAASQTLVIFIMMRVIDGPLDDEETDNQLLHTAQVITTRLHMILSKDCSRVELDGQRPLWKDWVFIESKRRTGIIQNIMFTLFHTNLERPCPNRPDYMLMPLPASKLLWRARDAEEWEREWEREVKESPLHAILRNGDLVKLRNSLDEAQNQRRADWDQWYASADELGLLIVLSANLDQP